MTSEAEATIPPVTDVIFIGGRSGVGKSSVAVAAARLDAEAIAHRVVTDGRLVADIADEVLSAAGWTA